MSRRLNTGQMTLPVTVTPLPPSVTTSRSALRRPLTAADVLTAAEVADLLRVPRSTVEDWARRGAIPSRKVGRRRLYLRPSIETLLLDGSSR
jgi:excisionase family DNA binding protein